MISKNYIRILHVHGALNAGGVSTWLVQILRRINLEHLKVDILTHTEEECLYDKEIKALGCRIIPCLHPSQPWRYLYNLCGIFRNGQYDIIHSHVFRLSGLIVFLANKYGIPVRIVHSRTTDESRRLNFNRKIYNTLMGYWIKHYSTHLLAVCPKAATALFGPNVLKDKRLQIFPSGIDLGAFYKNYDLKEIKKELVLFNPVKVVGHVGRFVEAKNHYFFMEIARYLSKKSSSIKFCLVGDGSLLSQMKAKAKELGIADRVIFAGVRRDVPLLLKEVFDLLLFPSKWEGTPRVVVEAQAAGVPCLISDVIPAEVDLVKPLVRRMSLRQKPEAWAEAAWELLSQPPPVSREEAWRQVAASPFNIVNNVRDLENLYLSAYENSRR